MKPENQKRKNYLKAPFRSPSPSSFVLNSRTAATLLFRGFLCFLFKGGFTFVIPRNEGISWRE
jgi:hypothetical protein